MKLKALSKRTLLIAGLTGITLLAGILLYSIPKNSLRSLAPIAESNVPLPSQGQVLPAQVQAGPGLPVRLKIPRLKVDAAVEYAGYAPDGTMEITKSLDKVAWFDPGKRPGQKGSAVIAGHYGWRNGKVAVFDKLYKMRKGDKVYVEDEEGRVTTFVVRESRRYDPDADASGVFGSHDGKIHLNLITCAGDWDKASETFSQRLVVFTDKE